MKQSIDEAAYDYATEKTKFRKDVLKEVDADNYVPRHADCMEDFQCGVEWRENQIPEHISTVQDCELAVKETKEKAIEILSKVLENWVHGGDADCIIAEFEEKLNKGQ